MVISLDFGRVCVCVCKKGKVILLRLFLYVNKMNGCIATCDFTIWCTTCTNCLTTHTNLWDTWKVLGSFVIGTQTWYKNIIGSASNPCAPPLWWSQKTWDQNTHQKTKKYESIDDYKCMNPYNQISNFKQPHFQSPKHKSSLDPQVA
jgi:hypothetical protein